MQYLVQRSPISATTMVASAPARVLRPSGEPAEALVPRGADQVTAHRRLDGRGSPLPLLRCLRNAEPALTFLLIAFLLQLGTSQAYASVWGDKMRAAHEAAQRKDFAAQERCLFDALQECRRMPDWDLRAAATLRHLVLLYLDTNQEAAAVRTLEKELSLLKATRADLDEDVALSSYLLGSKLHNFGQLRQAKVLYLEAIRIRKAILGPFHPAIVQPLERLGQVCYQEGNTTQFVRIYKQALSIVNRPLKCDPFNLIYFIGLARSYLQSGHYEEALAVCAGTRKQILALRQRKESEDFPGFLHDLEELSRLAKDKQRSARQS